MGLPESYRATFYLEATKDKGGGDPIPLADRAKEYVQSLLDGYPQLPADLAKTDHAPSILKLLETAVEAEGEYNQQVTEMTRLQEHLNTLTIRLAATVALAKGDLRVLSSIVSDEAGKKALAGARGEQQSDIEALADMEVLPSVDIPASRPPVETPLTDEADPAALELGEALSSLDEPVLHRKPDATIVEEEKPEPGITWVELLGQDHTRSDQELIIKIMNRLTQHMPELSEYRGNILGAIQKLADIEPDGILVTLHNVYEDPRSIRTIARFLALYHRVKTGEIVPKEKFLTHAANIQRGDEFTYSLLPLAQSPDAAKAGKQPAARETKTPQPAKADVEKQQAIDTLLELFGLFYEAAEANNFNGHWPIQNSRLAIIYGKLSTTFVEKAIKDGIVTATKDQKMRLCLNERDALTLLLYKLQERTLRNFKPNERRKRLNTVMRHYWEARDKFTEQYFLHKKTNLPYPGLNRG